MQKVKMKVKIFYDQSLEKNASYYYDRSKKAKKKLEGARKAIESSKNKLKTMEKKKTVEFLDPDVTEWYEKFRWFFTTGNKLVIGGRDATTNEIIIKKYMEKDDLVFHTDMKGSPFFVLKDGKDAIEDELKEVADATCSFSRAWKLGLGTQSVFYIFPDQISKTPKAGEYLTKGSFMINGKTNYIDNRINLAIGMLDDKRLMCAPEESVSKHCKKKLILVQGDKKTSEIAKKIKSFFKYRNLDYIIRVLPTGGIDIKRS